MQRICKPIGVLLAILMIVPLITVLPLTASALGTYVINGKTIMASDSSSSHGQCWAYANAIYKKIWGVNFTSQFNTSDNLLRDLEDEELTLTAEHLKAYVLAAELGASLRICNSPNLHANDSTIDGSPGHNQIIVQKDDEGFTVIQGGLSASPYYAENYYTWDGYVNTSWLGGRYSYIKYVKWPGAPSYAQIRAQSADGPFVTEVIAPTGNLLLGKSFSLAGVIRSAEPMTSVKGEVIDEQGNAVLSYTKSINSTSYNISTGGMDSNLKFGRLIVGGYHYVISATDAQGTHVVWDSYFTVCPSKVANEEKIYNFLINRGFNKAAVCAVLANIQVESNFSPTSTYTESGGYNSYGLCQWNLSRLDNLITFCQVHGYSQSSLEGQLLFMLDELQNGKYQTYRDVYNLLVSIPDTEDGAYDAAYLWTVNYEIPLNREAQGVVRGNLAKEYFLRYSEVTSINLTLNSRGGSAVSDRSMMYGYPYGVLPSPTRAGCTFDGWYTMPEGGTKVSSSTVLWATSDQVLYAHWIHNVYALTYVYDENTTEKTSYTFGDRVVLPENPERFGYTFAGWYDNAALTGNPVTQIGGLEYGNKTFYAKWNVFIGLSVESDGVYYMENGEHASGFRTVGGNTLYFWAKKNGKMITQAIMISGVTYRFEEFIYKGTTLYRVKENKNGFRAEEDGVRYYQNDQYVTGLRAIDGQLYYFDGDGWMRGDDLTINNKSYSFVEQSYEDMTLYSAVKQGLHEEDGSVRYYIDGVYQTGWQLFDDNKVYFSYSTGLMIKQTAKIDGVIHEFEPFTYGTHTLYRSTYKKNGFFTEDGGVRYYVDDEFVTGWLELDGNRMFFDIYTGKIVNYDTKIGGTFYHFEQFAYNGLTLWRAAKNGLYEENGGIRYYVYGEMQTGWQTFDGSEVYFRTASGLMLTQSAKIGGTVYDFEPFTYNGMTLYRKIIPKNGLYNEDGGIRYYINGTYKTGWQTFDGNRVWFRSTTGLMIAQRVMISGVTYDAEPFEYEGFTLYRLVLPKNGLYEEDGGIRYYVEGEMQTGWLTIDGSTLYFDPATGLMACESRVIGGTFCCFEAFEYDGMTLYRLTDVKNGVYLDDDGVRFYVDGVYQTGWQTIAGWQVYFTPGTGLMRKTDGVIDGVYRSFVIFEYNHLALYGLEGEGGDEPGQYTISGVTALLDALANGDTSYTISDVTNLLDMLAGR